MARTLDPVAHAIRRDAYVDAAIGRIQAHGYERLSIQDVIEATGGSRGAFFHYFDSKGALLAAVVERMVETAVGTVRPVVADPQLTAIAKFQGLLGGIAQWKRDQPEFQPVAVADLMRIWYSDENTIVVERMRAAAEQRLTPLLLAILRQGVAEGSFSLTSPEGTAKVLVALMLAAQDVATRLFIGRQDGSVSFEAVRCTLGAYVEALERILGLRKRLEWPLADDATLRFWFG